MHLGLFYSSQKLVYKHTVSQTERQLSVKPESWKREPELVGESLFQSFLKLALFYKRIYKQKDIYMAQRMQVLLEITVIPYFSVLGLQFFSMTKY